ncbi:8-oxo-dGTP diphosphatase [Natranaerovirga pectinivora]|uniref:8-oxo-dGTP diphosphatase n=1 Tax=Natranaerovirga pectinivora TaxID=682400 RepID=A0A4R3MRR5_9FIRM|nr:NUDIX domain-containing protein [Natranaerovirga pectinivora]TCT17203.1 8-oxo-dGTP diphosphatase [Natranaerovirga pectinivora]
MKVEFHPLDEKVEKLSFVVIQARYQGQWIFVRHKDRSTWEVPGGHIEKNEDVDAAAKRELKEETGALDFNLVPVCDYSVEIKEIKTFGRLYYAEVTKLGNLEYEIEEISFGDNLPAQLTYDKIQPHIFEKVKGFII